MMIHNGDEKMHKKHSSMSNKKATSDFKFRTFVKINKFDYR